MNRDQLQQLTQARILDAQALLDGGRWSFAYYNIGYAVECALKACFLARMPLTGWVFQDRVKIDDCRTHEFERLINLSGLRSELDDQFAKSKVAGSSFRANWQTVNLWRVESRYHTTTSELDARQLFAAITDQPDGVLSWIVTFW